MAAKPALDPSSLTFDEMRELIGKFVTTNQAGGKLWDVLTALRGPDSPSETPEMSPQESKEAYAGRRARKRLTVEVIRGKALGGMVGGSARYRTDINHVTLPPHQEWDHFDKHVSRAAGALGIEVKIQEKEKTKGWDVVVEMGADGQAVKKKKKFVPHPEGAILSDAPGTPFPVNSSWEVQLVKQSTSGKVIIPSKVMLEDYYMDSMNPLGVVSWNVETQPASIPQPAPLTQAMKDDLDIPF